MSDERISSGAIYLLLKELREDVKEIKESVKEQNGRVRKLENSMLQIKTLWSGAVVAGALFGDSIKRKMGL